VFSNINELFIISDTHFNHSRIAVYCNRPKDWQDLIINNWNETVNDNDSILHLGDFSFGLKENVQKIFDSLKGKKYLLRGNHDYRHSINWWKTIGFDVINRFYEDIDGYRFYFSHKPMQENEKITKSVNIFGHWHNKSDFICKHGDKIYINVSVEQIDYRPVKVNFLVEKVNEMFLSFN